MTDDNIFSIGIFIVIAICVSWVGFNVYKNASFANEQELKKLTLSAEQICALQPITNQTEFCRDRINFLNQNTVK